MDTVIDDLTAKFQEDVYLDFSKEELQTARKDFEGSVMIKLAGGRSFNKGVFTSMFKKLWGQNGRVSFSEVEDNTLMATFSSDSDRERVLACGSWLHMGWAVLVARWVPGKSLDELFTNKIQLVVQVHNLPLELRTETLARKCAAVAGEVIESFTGRGSNGDLQFQRRKFHRFKVEINLGKSIEPGCFLGRQSDNPSKAIFRYEKLPNCCFKCGLFDHKSSRCTNEERNSRIKYDKFIRADYTVDDDCTTLEKALPQTEPENLGEESPPLAVVNLEGQKSKNDNRSVEFPIGSEGTHLDSSTDERINERNVNDTIFLDTSQKGKLAINAGSKTSEGRKKAGFVIPKNASMYGYFSSPKLVGHLGLIPMDAFGPFNVLKSQTFNPGFNLFSYS